MALGLLSTSNPQLNVLDMLSKLSHDTDAEVSHNAIFGLGLVGAGTMWLDTSSVACWIEWSTVVS